MASHKSLSKNPCKKKLKIIWLYKWSKGRVEWYYLYNYRGDRM
jgi:hypothetical protein